MKVFSSCVSCSCFNYKIGNISFDKLNSKIESAIKKNKNLGMNACHKTAIQIAFMDQEISKETKKQLAESLYDNYSELYRNLMNVGENTLSQRLATNQQESGFLNFVKEDDSLCHTAYIKHYNGNYVITQKSTRQLLISVAWT
ncbi:hypothetical protein [Providencia rustigianii]|uniref:hypothetical protein n=1 Tax=Providencia rustigianii TaxID=158850 RepID=UPI0038B3C95A